MPFHSSYKCQIDAKNVFLPSADKCRPEQRHQLWSKVDIKKGDVLSWENVQSVRAPLYLVAHLRKHTKKSFPATIKTLSDRRSQMIIRDFWQ